MSDTTIGIKVAVRCRPFVNDDKLGVKLVQFDNDNGEVELLNSDYTTVRFPFSYAWWSAYGYQRRLQGDNMADADAMKLIDQRACYESCGLKIKEDLLDGDAVVLFAYGLSGSGKTFTVFGPDAADAPEAWFKWAEPHDLWGIFPRLAYDLFNEKTDGWRISMKYFQNVVDTVRDLMSPNAEERSYKSGMRADEDGFMDIDWCDEVVIKSWDELREIFQVANRRKAIAPTQFNPMSTRGHCIMTLEVETPNPDIPGMKRKGRLYVCDLAGTEPAGDILYANYEKKTFDDGSFEYEYKGPHPDQSRTMELRSQGMKINLSLSEMAQFFMKMAEAVKRNKLQPGMTIPGCNSFFLCRFLKTTMLQAKTYLFAAIRPEVEYHRYTFSTLGFAKNASVVQLKPKKVSVVASPAEKKLMEELEAMKALVEQMKAEAAAEELDDAQAANKIAELEAQLQSKQNDLETEVVGVPSERHNALQARLQEQREGYAKRGIGLTDFEFGTVHPYFMGMDEDPFRNNRFMYVLAKPETKFGDNGDINPFSYSIIDDHCVVKIEGDVITLIGGKGEVFHNGSLVTEGQQVQLALFDRVVMGEDMMMLRWTSKETDGKPMLSSEEAFSEYGKGLLDSRKSTVGASGAATAAAEASGSVTSGQLEAERARIMEERAKWEKERAELQAVTQRKDDSQAAVSNLDSVIMTLVPKTRKAKKLVDLLNRVRMTFEVVLERGADHVVKPLVRVENSDPSLTMFLEPEEFSEKVNILADEVSILKWKAPYEIPEANDPLFLFFDNLFLLGAAVTFPSHLIFNIGSGSEDWEQDVKSAYIPYDKIGTIESEWTPLAGVDPASWNEEVPVLTTEVAAIGKAWTARLDIKLAKLPVRCYKTYIQYDFFRTSYCTEVVKQKSNSPFFNYSFVHHVDSVTPEFIVFLKEPFELNVYVNPFVEIPTQEKLGTANTIVMESIRTGVPLGYQTAAPATMPSGVSPTVTAISPPAVAASSLAVAADAAAPTTVVTSATSGAAPQAESAAALAEIERLKLRIKQLESEMEELEEESSGCCYFGCCKKRRPPKIHTK